MLLSFLEAETLVAIMKTRFTKYICYIAFVPGCFSVHTVNSAEITFEPSIGVRAEYNDNLHLRPESQDSISTTGYTVDTAFKLKAEEFQTWQTSLDARGKVTRYDDIEDSDSNNVFFNFMNSLKTEMSSWHLDVSFSRNTNLDTDYDTQNVSSIIGLSDRTLRETLSTFTQS